MLRVVGWVERSEPHQVSRIQLVGLAPLDPPYFFGDCEELMRRAMAILILGPLLAALGGQPARAGEPKPPVQTGKGHPFVCTDYSQGMVFVVSAAGKVEWKYHSGHGNDLWVLPNGNLLFNTGHGVREITRGGKTVFQYQSPSEIWACQRLAGGNTFIGECNAGRLIEVEPQGKLVKEIRLLPAGKDGGHLYMRNARVLAGGHYLVTLYGAEAVCEYDPQGKLLRRIPAPGGPHSAVRLPGGNTLIACGDLRHKPQLIEVDPQGKIVWSVRDGDLPGISLKFMTGFQACPTAIR